MPPAARMPPPAVRALLPAPPVVSVPVFPVPVPVFPVPLPVPVALPVVPVPTGCLPVLVPVVVLVVAGRGPAVATVRVLVAVGCVPPVTAARVPVTVGSVAVVIPETVPVTAACTPVVVAVITGSLLAVTAGVLPLTADDTAVVTWVAVLVAVGSVLVAAVWLTEPDCDPAAEPSTAPVRPLPAGGAAVGNGAWSAPDPVLAGPALGEAAVAVALAELTADVVAVAAWATAEPSDSGLVPVVPGRAGICAAAAGWARSRARIKAAAKPPQVYTHTRRTSSPTLDSPTLERMATFPSMAR
jgi:hypothetical protein